MNQPNILLITTDQQRYDAAGGAGPAFLRTPHYDLLRREGITFTSAYADCPICVPSRVATMTGKQVFNHGMSANGQTSKVMGRERTLPAYLRQLGYQTAAIGKMHFGPSRARHGFEEMILPADYYRDMERHNLPYQPMQHGLGQNELYPGMATVPENLTLTSWIANQCMEYIRQRRDPSAPFFLWCSFSKPHPPLDPPEPYYSMYNHSDIPGPVYGEWSEGAECPPAFLRRRWKQSYDLISPEVIRAARSAYYGLITQIDYNIGRVFAALQDLGMFDDTLIIYTSDHGEFLGDHHNGGKRFFYEPSAHVPFVLRMPKSWDNRCHGTVNQTLVTHADILPTVVKAAGGVPANDIDGEDLIACARGQLEQPRQFLEACQGEEYCAITDGRWKYIWYVEGGREQLFDLQTDPQELKNLAGVAEAKGKLSELRRELVSRQAQRGSAFVQDGELVRKPVHLESEEDCRNSGWMGFHTEYFPKDVKH